MTLHPARLFLTAWLLAAAAGTAHAAPDLAVLGYPTGPGKLKDTGIELKAGAVESPFAGQPQTVWILAPGDILETEQAPAPRQIQFYRRNRGQPAQLLCTVAVKYFPAEKGWRPAYRIEERFALVEQGNALVPLPRHTGDLGITQLRVPQAPNVEGYFPALEFGLPGTPVAIDFWVVK
jgi:hypothetical protein